MSSIKSKLFNNYSEEQPVQDESDGLLFFHGHSLWEVLNKVEAVSYTHLTLPTTPDV